MWAPEAYIRDMCAMYIHQQLKIPVSIEVSHRYFEELWRFDVNECKELGGFKVDLATRQTDHEGRQIVTALVEFKLYTGDGAERDINRLRTLIEIAARAGARVEGYLVICEQAWPEQKIGYVRNAFAELSKKSKIAAQNFFEIDEVQFVDSHGVQHSGSWPVGIAVIDVGDNAP
jgi:hypothetical protein